MKKKIARNSGAAWILLILSLSLTPSLSGCHGKAVAEEAVLEEAIPVHTAEVALEERALPIRTSGRLSAKAEVNLAFKIGGFIDRIFVDEGARVQQGQELARLNLAEIDAQVLQARSAHEKAQRDLARMETLYRDSVVTLAQLQDTRTGLEATQAALEMARFNRRHAVITAPHHGRILRRMAEENEWVAPGAPLLILSASGEGWVVRVGLADRDVVKLRLGDAAQVTFDAYPDRAFAGYVTEIADAADPIGGTFEVEVQVPDPEGLLKSGFVARVDLRPSVAEPFFFVPVEALVEGDGAEGSVYALEADADRVRKVPVQIAEVMDQEIAVRSGLEGVTHVITDGAVYLADGSRVKVVTALE